MTSRNSNVRFNNQPKSNSYLIRWKVFVSAICFGLILFVCGFVVDTNAATITVNSIAEDATSGNGQCTLREAITNANNNTDTSGGDCAAGSGTDTINITVTGTINLATALPDLNSDMGIDGPGLGLVINRSSGSSFRIFTVSASGSVSISNLTVTNGVAVEGGGIRNAGALTLDGVLVTNNFGLNGGGGAGISNVGSGASLNIVNSSITNNQGSGFFCGGGINNSGNMFVNESTISGNIAGLCGGGIYNSRTTVLTNVTISGNQSQTQSGGFGGGGINNEGGGGTLALTGCTVTNNTNQSSISGGGGIYFFGVGSTVIRSTIIAGNISGTAAGKDIEGTFNSQGYNLVGRSDGSSGLNSSLQDQWGTNATPLDARLGPLASNGGPTQTHALLTSPISPAIDKGNAFSAGTDQRGAGFPRTFDDLAISPASGGDNTDIGAFEVQTGVPSTPPTLGNYTNTSIPLSSNTTITPDAAPTFTDYATATTTANFKGKLEVNPSTGVVRVTNAQPAGTYTVTITAFGTSGTTTKTFTLTVTTPAGCGASGSTFFSGGNYGAGDGPVGLAIGDFNGDGKQDMVITNATTDTVTVLLRDAANTGFDSGGGFAVGSFPLSAAVGDFNGDGKQDIVVANDNSNNVSVLLRNAANTGFDAAVNYSVGSIPYAAAVGDFNADGKYDIAVVNFLNNNVSVLMRNAANTGFDAAVNYSVGSSPDAVAVGDFNGDGKHDIAAANYTGASVSVLLRNAANTGFDAAVNYSVGNGPAGIATADFNGDGRQDIVTANYSSNNVSVLLRNAANTGFDAAVNLGAGSLPISIAAGDFNNDGRHDIVSSNSGSNNVSVYLRNAANTGFTPVVNYGVGANPNAIAVGDFNGDNKQDIAVPNTNNGNVSVLQGGCNAAPTIAAQGGITRQQGSPVSNSTIATVNDAESGANGVTVTITSANPSNGVTVSNIVNTNGTVTANIIASCSATNASFTLQASDGITTTSDTLNVTVTANTAPTLTYSSPQTVALNGSLNVTPTTATDNGTVTYSVLGGHGLTTAPTVNSSGVVSITSAAPGGPHTVTIRAMDNCGTITDSAFTLNVNAPPPTLGNYPNTSIALSSNTTIISSGEPTNTVSINVSASTSFKGKLEGDPTTGVVRVTDAHPAGTYPVTVTAFNSTGNPTTKTFTLTVTTPSACANLNFNSSSLATAFGPDSVVVGDFDEDGNQDLATANRGNSNITILLGNGSGGFTSISPVFMPSGVTFITVGDFDGDGKQDLVSINADNTLFVLKGDGLGGFSQLGSTINAGNLPSSISVGDFNGDAKQDLAVSNSLSDNLTLLRGDGAGGFTQFSGSPVSVGTAPNSIAIGDFDGDGKQDLAVANTNSVDLSILKGDGAGGFTQFMGSPIPMGFLNDPFFVTIGDFDEDGKQDLATANNGSSTVSVLKGDGLGGFTQFSGSPVSVGNSPRAVVVGDFDGDSHQDLATANQFSNDVTALKGNGTGGFTSYGSPFAVGSIANSIAIGDFNEDGLQDLVVANMGSNNVTLLLRSCNTAPTITAAAPLSRQQGSAAINAQIATVSDADQTANTLSVTATPLTGSGVTVSNISIDSSGNVTADVLADCTATNSTFTLTVSDNMTVTATDTLTVNVIANTPPVLSYTNQSVTYGSSLTINPATSPSDNGSVSSIVLQSQGTYTGTISVDNTTGVVSISSAAPTGTHTITIRITDNCNSFVDVQFTLTVNCPTITVSPESLTFATYNVPYNVAITANGGIGPYTFSYTGTLPNGLPLDSSGNLTGTPTETGMFNITVTATDTGTMGSCAGNKEYTLVVNKAKTTTTITNAASLATPSTIGQSYTVQWSVTVDSPSSGTPTGTVTVSDGFDSCNASVSAGQCNITSTTVGTKTITATYSGDVNFNGSTSSGVSHQVDCAVNPVVMNNNDSGTGSLREAVDYACDGSTITFDNSVTGTITLTSGEIAIDKNLTIQGAGANVLAISGNDTNRVFNIGNFAVNISGLTLQNGRSNFGGAIIVSGGTLVLDSVVVKNNTVTNNGGGVLFTGGTNHQIRNSTITGNSALSCAGFQNDGNSSLTVTNTTVSGNSTIDGGGGAGFCTFDSTATLRGVTVTNNSAIGSGSGGGINFAGASPASATLNLGNTIVAGNSAPGQPDISHNGGTLITSGYNLIGNNDSVSGVFPAGNPNVNNDIVGTSGNPVNPLLGPLVNNGGATPTHRLRAHSPALDKGNSFGLMTDQRGLSRPVDLSVANASGGNGVDIGAFESQYLPIDVPVDFDGDGKSDYSVVTATIIGTKPNSEADSQTIVMPIGGDILADERQRIWNEDYQKLLMFRSGRGFIDLPKEVHDSVESWKQKGDKRQTENQIEAPSSMTWTIYRSSDGQTLTYNLGTTSDKLVPADYNGDGKCDAAVWTPSTGVFTVIFSSDLSIQTYSLGASSSDPTIVGDYDGDGRADPAVYDQSTGTWSWLAGTNHNQLQTQVWMPNGITAPGDYNGDGKFDFAIQLPPLSNTAAAKFRIAFNDGSVGPNSDITLSYGLAVFAIVPGDYDGDGKCDIAQANLSGTDIIWRVARSSSNYTLQVKKTFGAVATDRTTQGDYDGDGKIDFAVYRVDASPNDGVFRVFQSSSSTTTTFDWGGALDNPVAFFNTH